MLKHAMVDELRGPIHAKGHVVTKVLMAQEDEDGEKVRKHA
jgi:hypothetical protein